MLTAIEGLVYYKKTTYNLPLITFLFKMLIRRGDTQWWLIGNDTRLSNYSPKFKSGNLPVYRGLPVFR